VTDWNEETRQIAQKIASTSGVKLAGQPRERDFCYYATFEHRGVRMTLIVATVTCLEDGSCERVIDPAKAALSTWKRAVDVGYEAAK